jgi:dipeptidyl aminopeptidase/acylaminoacyl peptidase
MSTSDERYLSIQEVVSVPQLSDPSVSENGQFVAYVKKTANWDDNAYRNYVWIVEKETEKSYPLTSGNVESSHPRWSLDSQYLAYLSSVGEGEQKKAQIFIKSVDKAEGFQVSHAEQSVEAFKWAPDGKGFFYIAKAPETEHQKRRKDIYGDFEYIDQEYYYNSLYYLDHEKGRSKTIDSIDLPKDLREHKEKDEAVQQLTNGSECHVYQFDISPDRKTVVFSAAPSPNTEDLHKQELYLLDVETRNITKLDNKGLFRGDVIFSCDGSKICYTRFLEENAFYNNGTLEIYDLKTREMTQPVLDIDENIRPVRWVQKGILFEWQDKTNFRIGLVADTGEVVNSLISGEDSVSLFPSITLDGQNLTYIKAISTEPPEVYLNEDKVTEQYTYYEGKLLSKKEVVRWSSTDGLEIEGILSTPVDFDSSQKYPLLVVIHGGPAAASFAVPTQNKYYPIEQFVEKGFIVLEPNYRGSSGYGEAFRKANYRKLGVGDYDDVIYGVDALIEKGIVDKEKVGVMGWSQGGYISAFCATYSDRFKAISVGAGISNWMTYYVNTDIHQFTRMYLGGTPWNDEEIYRKTSPMTYIKSACTPTLIQHGEKDVRVPVPNAFELYQGLKDMGVQTELVIFKGMGHGSNKPGFNRAILKQNLLWFCHHIMGESMKNFQSFEL